MISVLLPTRLRAGWAQESVQSLRERAYGPIEVLLAVDEDDPTDYSDVHADQLWRTPRWGYAALHHYYNLLSETARGDWLLIWNDDAFMTTEGWDEAVRQHEPNVVLSPNQVHRPLCTFPLVPREFVKTVGHFSLNAHCDTWWQDIALELEVLTWLEDVWIDHRRFDLTGEEPDEVYAERRYQTHEFYDVQMRTARQLDVQRLRLLLGSRV